MLPPGGEGSELWMNWDRWNLEPRRASEARGGGILGLRDRRGTFVKAETCWLEIRFPSSHLPS